MAACYFRHGPNAPELCRELGEAYMRMRADAPGAMGLHGKVFSRVLKAPRVPNYTPDYVPGREAVAPGV